MSSRKWLLRVGDILRAISSIQKLTANMVFEEFISEETIIIVWDSIQNDLEPLTIQLQSLLEQESNCDR